MLTHDDMIDHNYKEIRRFECGAPVSHHPTIHCCTLLNGSICQIEVQRQMIEGIH
jgi:hypothetical protein